MATHALMSTVVMGAALLAILAVVLRLRDWQHPTPSIAGAGAGNVAKRANGPLGWSIAFFVVAFGVMGLTVLYVTGEPVAGLDSESLGWLALGVIGVVFSIGALGAVHAAVRSRGLNSAQAAAVSSTLVGVLILSAIVARLLWGG
jgi:hypothetical protein